MVLSGLMLPGAAWAQTCTVSTSATAFGIYEPFNTLPTDTAGAVNVRCGAGVVSLLVSFSISLTPGSGGSYAARSMTSGPNRLNYQLYRDLLRTQVWGDGTGGSLVLSDGILLNVGSILQRSYPVYGRVPARQAAVPGSYADSVVVLVTY